MFRSLLLFVLLLVATTVVKSTTSPTQSPTPNINLLYSVSSDIYNNKELLVINPWNKKVMFNNTLDFSYIVLDILSLDTTTNTLILLCTDSIYEYLISIDTTSTNFNQLSEIKLNYNIENLEQSYIFIEDQKTAIIPAMVSTYSNQVRFPSSLQFDFGTQSINLFNLSMPDFSSSGELMAQGFDFIKNQMYITYQNTKGGINLLSYNYQNPEPTQKIYTQFQNMSDVNMVFTDPSSNLYFIKYNQFNYNGNVDICLVNLADSTCETIFTVYIGDWSLINYLPFVLSQDKQTVLFITNQSSNSGNQVLDQLTLTYFQLNTNYKQTYTIQIENDDQNNHFFARNFKI